METDFEFSVGSGLDFEDLIADIGFGTTLVAFLTQEEGFENMRIQLYPPKDKQYWDFKLDEFLSIIERAKARLYDLRRTESSENVLSDDEPVKKSNSGLVVDKDFTFTIKSGVKFEEFIVIITADSSKLAVLTQEEGFENVRVQLYRPKKEKFWDLRLDNFLSIIEQAKVRLYDFRKSEPKVRLTMRNV